MIEAVEGVCAIEDEVQRARAISDLLKAQDEKEPELRKERRRIVLAMNARKVSIRKIAAAINVSPGTVQDIIRGHSHSWGRGRKTTTTKDADAADNDRPADGSDS